VQTATLILLFVLLSLPFLELSANIQPKEDGDYQPEDIMNVDEGASPRKGKGKSKAPELEEQEGAARCVACAGCGSQCWVDPTRIKRWKETVARRTSLHCTPAGMAYRECSGRKQKCFLQRSGPRFTEAHVEEEEG